VQKVLICLLLSLLLGVKPLQAAEPAAAADTAHAPQTAPIFWKHEKFVLAPPADAVPIAAEASPTANAQVFKWHGGIWASAVFQQRKTADSSIFFRPVDGGESTASLDGAILGADVDVGRGFGIKFTFLAGNTAHILNLSSGETGSFAMSEASFAWTGASDVVRVGRMNTFLGMEQIDGTQNVTASRGILFTYMDPYGQVGVSWHHAFSPWISVDSWVFGGEDRMVDNNYSKTVGLGLTWNRDGATDKFVSLVAFRGAEQDRSDANGLVAGAEDRQRLRLAMMGGWAWADTTLQWEGHLGKEDFAAGALTGSTAAQTARWLAGGIIFRQGLVGHFGLFGRAEYIYDSSGVRLSIDPTIAASYRNQFAVDLQAISGALGLDYKEEPTFARLEIREDQLNKDVKGLEGRIYRNGLSCTLCVGAGF